MHGRGRRRMAGKSMLGMAGTKRVGDTAWVSIVQRAPRLGAEPNRSHQPLAGGSGRTPSPSDQGRFIGAGGRQVNCPPG